MSRYVTIGSPLPHTAATPRSPYLPMARVSDGDRHDEQRGAPARRRSAPVQRDDLPGDGDQTERDRRRRSGAAGRGRRPRATRAKTRRQRLAAQHEPEDRQRREDDRDQVPGEVDPHGAARPPGRRPAACGVARPAARRRGAARAPRRAASARDAPRLDQVGEVVEVVVRERQLGVEVDVRHAVLLGERARRAARYMLARLVEVVADDLAVLGSSSSTTSTPRCCASLEQLLEHARGCSRGCWRKTGARFLFHCAPCAASASRCGCA